MDSNCQFRDAVCLNFALLSRRERSTQGHGYVLADASGKYQPIEWAKLVIPAYRAHHADRIVAERNTNRSRRSKNRAGSTTHRHLPPS
jgi:hypothetical protein